MLCDIIILEPSTSFYCDHITVTVSCNICDPSCDYSIILNPHSRFPSIENKEKEQ